MASTMVDATTVFDARLASVETPPAHVPVGSPVVYVPGGTLAVGSVVVHYRGGSTLVGARLASVVEDFGPLGLGWRRVRWTYADGRAVVGPLSDTDVLCALAA